MIARRCTAFLLLAVMLLIALPAFAQESRQITIGSYNVKNFFDVFDDPYMNDEETAVKPRADIESLARAVRSLNADVVAFQEVENEHVIKAMADAYLRDAGYRHIVASYTNSNRGIRLVVMSKLPIASVTSYHHRELRLPGDERRWDFARDLFRVTLKVNDVRNLDLFVVHFKSKIDSKGDPGSQAWRLAEATMARSIIDEILRADAGAWVAIAGDFNDTPETKTIAAFTDWSAQRPGLTDVHADRSADRRITYLHKPYRSTIDYILVSPALAKRYVANSSRVLTDEDLLSGSDHAPIVASFNAD
jgi:endonuclease/exonuclease/phosphatase family metal-dependent hydrolase